MPQTYTSYCYDIGQLFAAGRAEAFITLFPPHCTPYYTYTAVTAQFAVADRAA